MTRVPTRIVVARGPGETRAGLFAEDTLLEVAHIRDAQAQPGAFYAGRVGEKLSGSADVFVSLGVGPPGLLEAKGAKLTAGQLIAVEVQTPARADKGPKLTFAKAKLPEGVTSPCLIRSAPHPAQLWWQVHRDSITDIEVPPGAQLQLWRKMLGHDAPISSLRSTADLDEQIDAALEDTVRLPSGGRISIEATRALIAIDVDAGSSGIDIANGEAMAAIAHHMRLRQLAGHILIDLIPVRQRASYLAQLTAAVADDPNRPQVMGFTPSGMIDVVRRRTHPSLSETLCDSRGRISAVTVAYRALRLACAEMLARKTTVVTLKVSAEVQAVLNEELAGALTEARTETKGDIVISVGPGFDRSRIEIS